MKKRKTKRQYIEEALCLWDNTNDYLCAIADSLDILARKAKAEQEIMKSEERKKRKQEEEPNVYKSMIKVVPIDWNNPKDREEHAKQVRFFEQELFKIQCPDLFKPPHD